MAIELSTTGGTNTDFQSPEGVVDMRQLNYAADFAVKINDPDNVLLTSTKADALQPETIRISQREIKDVYAGTAISAGAQLPIKSGRATLHEVCQTWKFTDPGDASFVQYAPVRFTIASYVPDAVVAYESALLDALLTAFASCFAQNSNTAAQMQREARGVLLPAALL